MKVWKIVSGILSIVLSAIIFLQSAAAGLVNTLEENGSTSGTAGFLVAVLLLSAGIVSIATNKKLTVGPSIAMAILCFIAALIGFTGADEYKDLLVWAIWCVLCGVMAILCMILGKKKRNEVKSGNE